MQFEKKPRLICGVPEKEKTPAVQKLLDYGTKHEIDAMATLVGKVMPVLYPDLTYYEERCIPIYVVGTRFMVVSPDMETFEKDSRQVMNRLQLVYVCKSSAQCLSHIQRFQKDTFCNVTQKWKFSE
jgi:hypothetical protein